MCVAFVLQWEEGYQSGLCRLNVVTLGIVHKCFYTVATFQHQDGVINQTVMYF